MTILSTNSRAQWVDSGLYFKSTEVTPQTPAGFAITTSYSPTAAAWTLRNNASAGGRRIFLDYIKLDVATVPASATRADYAIATDVVARYSSGGAGGENVIVNPNTDASATSVAVQNIGTVVLASATSAARLPAMGCVRRGIPVAGDQYLFTFGGASESATGFTSGTAASRFVMPCGPIVIGPGSMIALHIWNAANAVTAPAYDLEAGWWER